MFRKSIAVAMVAAVVAFAGGVASAATFTLDTAASKIKLTRTLDLCIGCGVSTKISDASWEAGPGMSHKRIDKFIKWNVGSGFGGELYNIEAKLAFSSPSNASGTTTGSGGVGTIFGILSGGYVSWNGPGHVNFADGSKLSFVLDDFKVAGLGKTVKSGVTFKTTVPEVPLPAAGWLLLAGLGGMAAMKRRQKAA